MHPGDALLGAHGEGAADHALHGGHGLVGRPHLRQDPLRLGQQRPARLRQRHPPGGPYEQRGAQFPLQGPDRRRQARLGDHQAFGGPGEVLVLGDRDEVLEVAQFHD